VLLAQTCAPAIAFATPKPKEKPVPREVVERRGTHSKTLDNGDGTYTYQSFMTPIHYRAPGSSTFEPIDSTLEPTDVQSGAYGSDSGDGAAATQSRGWKNRANRFALTLPEHLGEQWASVETSQARVAWRPASSILGPLRITDPVSAEGTVSAGVADAVDYAHPFGPASSLNCVSVAEGVKESIVLSRYDGTSTFSFDLTLAGLTPRIEKNGSIGLYVSAEATSPAWTIATPYMEDSAAVQDPAPANQSNVHYELEPIGLYWRLDVVADPTWLAAPERVFPVTIDPTITENDYGTWRNNSYPVTMDAFITDANPSTNFGNYWSGGHAELRVGYTAGAGNNFAYIMPDVADLMAWNAVNRVKIIAANMNLNCYSRTGGGGAVTVGKVNGGWGEGTITWNNPPTPSYTDLTSAWVTVNTRTRFPVGATVQQWMDTADAKGFVFHAGWADPAGYAKFDAREGGSVGPVFECSFTTQPKVTFTLPPADTSAQNSPTVNWSTYDMWGKAQSKVNIKVKRIDGTGEVLSSITGTGTIATLPAPGGSWSAGRYLVSLQSECVAPPTTGYTAVSEWTPWTPFDIRPLTSGSNQVGVLPYRAGDSMGGGAVDLATGRLLLGRADYSGPGQAGPLGISATYDSSRTTDGDGVGKGFRLDIPTLSVADEQVVNGGFETADGSGASGWTRNNTTVVTREAGSGRLGAALKFVSASTTTTYTAINGLPASQALPVYPGQSLVATAWVKTANMSHATGATQRGAVLRFHYFDDAGNDLGETKYASSTGVVSNTGAAWRQITLRADVPEGAYRASVAVEVIRASGTVYFDDVHFGDGKMVMTDSGGTTRPFAQIGKGVYQRDPLAPTLSVKRADALSGIKPVMASGVTSGTTGASTDGNLSISTYDYVPWNASGSAYLQYDLPHPAVLSQLNLYLWDGIETSQRTYKYRIDVLPAEVADPDNPWNSALPVVTDTETKSWNTHTFAPIKARAVRVYALNNTANWAFHVAEIQAPVTLVNDAAVVTDSSGHVTHAADEAGNLTTYDWDYTVKAAGRLRSIADTTTSGRSLTLNWDANQDHLESLDYTGRDSDWEAWSQEGAVIYGGDATHLTISRKKDDGSSVVVATYGYTGDRVTSITDADGVHSDISWQSGRVASISRALSSTATVTTSYDYSTADRVTITTSGGGLSQSRTVVFDPDLGNQVTSTVADPAGLALTTSYTYDGYGHATSSTNPGNETDEYVRDAHGNALTVRTRVGTSLQQTETATYTNDRVAGAVDAKGNVSSRSYDWAWREVSSEVALTNSSGDAVAASTQAYDDWGNRERDDIPVSTASNLLEDPAFEHDPFATGGGWIRDANMALRSTGAGTQDYLGRSYIEGTGGTQVNAKTDPVTIKPNETYQVSAWTRGAGAVIVKQFAGATLKSTTTVIDVTSGNVGLGRQVGAFVARSDATSCEVWLCSYASGGHAAFDNVRLEAANAAGTDDWLENESFERQPVIGAPYHWIAYAGAGYFADKVPTGSSGANATMLRLASNPGVRTDSGSWSSERLRVRPSETYSVGISMATSKVGGAPGDDNAGAAAQVYFYASDATPDSNPISIVRLTGTKLITGSTDMIRYSNRIDVPDGATSAKFVMILHHAEGAAYFDNATMEPAISVTTYEYDRTHTFATTTSDVTGGTTTGVTDARGRTTSSSYTPKGGSATITERSTYDGLDRLTGVVTAPGNELEASAAFAYTDGGKLTQITDPRGKVTSMGYDAVSGLPTSVTGPGGVITETSYDALGRVAAVSKPHLSGQAAETMTVNVYDVLGRVTATTTWGEPGQTAGTQSVYDSLSRVTSSTVSMTGAPSYIAHTEFDARGRVSSADASGPAGPVSAAATFDAADLPLTYAWNALGASGTITNTYAKTNEWLTTNYGGVTWSFTSGADGSTRQISSPLASLSIDSDAAHRISTLRASRASASGPKVQAFGQTLAYDGWNRISTERFSSTAPGLPSSMADSYQYYDAAGALRTWSRTGTGATSESYAYDAAGNIATITRDGETMTFSVDDDNRLLSTVGTSTTTYTNDLLGRRTSRVTPSLSTTYTYDASGDLATITAGPNEAHYAYGPSGMRELKTITGESTSTVQSYWSGSQLMAERDDDGTVYSYLYGPGGLPLQLSVKPSEGTTSTYAFLTDRAGSVVGLTDSAGTVVASYTYDPWGNPKAVGGSNDTLAARQPLRYRGYYWDTESGLYYMPARYYDPAVGRFLTVDPEGAEPGDPITLNAYTYCVNNPVMFDDPEGTSWWSDTKKWVSDKYNKAKAKFKKRYPKAYRVLRPWVKNPAKAAKSAVKSAMKKVVASQSKKRSGGGRTPRAGPSKSSGGRGGGGSKVEYDSTADQLNEDAELLIGSDWASVPGHNGWESRYDTFPDEHYHFRHRGVPRLRKVDQDGRQTPHGGSGGEDKDVPEDVIRDNPRKGGNRPSGSVDHAVGLALLILVCPAASGAGSGALAF